MLKQSESIVQNKIVNNTPVKQYGGLTQQQEKGLSQKRFHRLRLVNPFQVYLDIYQAASQR